MIGSLPESERERRVNIMLGRVPSPFEGTAQQPWWKRAGTPARLKASENSRWSTRSGVGGSGIVSSGAGKAGTGGGRGFSSAKHEGLSLAVKNAQADLNQLVAEEQERQEAVAKKTEMDGAQLEALHRKLASCTADMDSWLEKVEAVKDEVTTTREEEAQRRREEEAMTAATRKKEEECRALDSEAVAHRERGRLARALRHKSGKGDVVAQRQREIVLHSREVAEAEEMLASLRDELRERQVALQRVREMREQDERKSRELDAELHQEVQKVRDALRAHASHGRHAQANVYRERILQEQERESLCRSIQREVLLQGQERVMRVQGTLEQEMEEERASAHKVSLLARLADEEQDEVEAEAQKLMEGARREEAEATRRRIEALHAATMAELKCKLARARRDVSREHGGVRDVCEMLDAATDLSLQLTSMLESMRGEDFRGSAGSGRVCVVEGPQPQPAGRQKNQESAGGVEGDDSRARKRVQGHKRTAGCSASGGPLSKHEGGSGARHASSGVNPRYRQQLLRLQLHALKSSREAD